MEILSITFFWFLLALAVAILARSRGRSGLFWFIAAAIISPLIAAILLLAGKNLAAEKRRQELHAALQRGGASRADEIEKLAALKDKGIITPKEFERQKTALLS